jgi:ubiquitin carboxyl-terminal hydrolase 36/42
MFTNSNQLIRIVFEEEKIQDKPRSEISSLYKMFPLPENSAISLFKCSEGKFESASQKIDSIVFDEFSNDMKLFYPPPYFIFPHKLIEPFLNWSFSVGNVSGLDNCGNTCFMNSVFQCLAFTPSFAGYLLHKKHSLQCQKQGFCVLCELEKLFIEMHLQGKKVVNPIGIVKNLRLLDKKFVFGKQGDAEEFIQILLDGAHNICLPKQKFEYELTILSQLFLLDLNCQ